MQHWSSEHIIDYLDNRLSLPEREALEEALAQSPDLRQQLQEYRLLQDQLQSLPVPTVSDRTQTRFDQFLAKAISEQTEQPTPWRSYRWLAVAASIAILFMVGTYFFLQHGQIQQMEKDLTATRTLVLELIQQDRSSARIKAANLTFLLSDTDQEVISQLGHLLLHDPDANVRLAALDALGKFDEASATREVLLQALTEDQPEVVRFSLLNLLIDLKETRAIPHLERWIETDSLSQPIRDLARLGRFKMI